MKKIINMASLMCFLSFWTFEPTSAQIVRCGVSDLNPSQVQAIRDQLNQYLALGKSALSSPITIPIAVHVIRYDNGAGDVSNQTINDQIAVLNNNYAGTNFRFTLYSISRTNNTIWATHKMDSDDEINMKQTLAVNPNRVLNLYFCPSPTPTGLLGYATFPWMYSESSYMHGVVVKSTTVPGGSETNYNQGKTATHEVGHYLGLFHTFQNGCTPPGDNVDDTPYEASAAYGCPSGRNTCPSPGEDPIHNYMNYSYDACMYEMTPGQSARMNLVVPVYKPSLYNVVVTVEQRRENNTLMQGSSIARWESGLFQNYTVPISSFTFGLGTQETFRGQQTMVSNPDEKYNRWVKNQNIDDLDVTNHHTFSISSDMTTLTSQFKTIHNATLQAQLVEGGNPSGVIEFKDPWLIDYPDPDFGNNLRNQGMSAPFKSVSYAPNNIGVNTAYKGVFLNQSGPTNNWLPPYYSVGAPSTQTFTVNGQNYDAYFSHWSGTNVTFQHATALQTGVVFHNAGATAIANYKGHLITNSNTALASNGQRKIIQDDAEVYHLVYESGGNIYHTRSTDGGSSWQPEVRVNPIIGNCFSSSITYNQNRQEHIMAWLQDITGTRYACVATSSDFGETWTHIQSITAPNAQQLQVSSMTATAGSPDLLVWREGTSMLKGTLRRYGPITFGTVRNLRLKDYNTITGFSLSAFGRTDRWDMVWTENDNLYYSSIYDNPSTGEPWMDFGVSPAVVASAGDWIHLNPSLVKTGTNLTVAWESYNFELVRRNIKVVQITPSPTNGYPTIGTATTFSNNGSSSYYYTPSISSHSNNNLSLSWRSGTSTILSAKRVNGSWQTVTTLGTGVDPSASERIFNTQSASLHFRRGTSLPYVLAQSTISTGGMEKSGDREVVFAGEGREIRFSSAKGTSSFLLLNAKSGETPVKFSTIDESHGITSRSQLRMALQSAPFVPSDNVAMDLFYKNSGELAPVRKVRVLLEEVTPQGLFIRTLGVAKEYEGEKKVNETLAFTLPKTDNPVRLIIDPVLRDDSMSVEVSRWYVINATEETFEKAGETKPQTLTLAPAVLALMQNYPNPFNPSTTIEFTVPHNGYAKLTVYNSLGQSVATLFDGLAQSGYVQKATFDGSALASGMYFCRLEFDGKTMMKKLALVK